MMTEISVVFEIAGTDYGNCVQQVDIKQETLNGVGTWEIIADPGAGCVWPAVNTITTDSPVHIQINDGAGPVTMMRGYLDDALSFLARTGYHTRLYRIPGRNRGMDLAQHYVSARYQNTRADLILAAMLGIIPSEITLVLVGAPPPNLNYEADRTYLADGTRDIADLVDYDFYVDNTAPPANANLNFFVHGVSPSGVTLYDFADSPLNNILSIDPCGEEVGFNIKNYVEAHAGSLEDHYTNMNAVGWAATNCIITNDTVLFLNNGSAIRATNNTGAPAQPAIDLIFPRYSYASLNLSEPTIGSVNYLIHDTANAIKRVRIQLRDTTGAPGPNEIEFYRSAFAGFGKCFNCTDQPTNDEWRKLNFPLGFESGIEPALIASTQGIWYAFNVPAPPFNWAAIDRIRFTTTGVNINNNDYFIVDGLSFPNHEVRSIQQNVTEPPGQRMKDFFRPDIKSQLELDAYATQKLSRLQDAKETIKVVAIGQTGTPYAAQTIEVVAPDFGIGGPLITDTVTYRILRLHHKVVKSSSESEKEGYTFTTEYDLVRHQYYGTVTTQLVEQSRSINITNPVESAMRIIRLEEQYRRRSAKGVRLSP